MAKGIIVVNIPESCSKCGQDCSHIVRTSLCPIKDLPKKKPIDYTMDDVDMCVAVGWNSCIDEILGE
jgi:hypothetical protein